MPERATYDYRGLGMILRRRLEEDGRGWRVCADEIGVTSPDLSRISAGQAVSVAKVIAVCDWLKISVRAHYQKPKPETALFHGKSTETGATARRGTSCQKPLPPGR